MAIFGSESEILDLRPDLGRVAALDAFAMIVTAPGDTVDFVSRFFAPRQGIPEDPATGSSHCTLAPYWAARLRKSELAARQLSARGGEITCWVRGDRVIIGGRTVEYLRGEIDVEFSMSRAAGAALVVFVALACAISSPPAAAQHYPTRPIRLIIPFPPGSSTNDILGRALASHIKAGRLRAIGMASLSRSALMPEVPTISEQGLPGFEVNSWSGVVAPAGTPQPIIRRLYEEIAKIVNGADMRNFMLHQGAEPALMDPQQFGAYLKAEIAKWGKVVRAAHVKVE